MLGEADVPLTDYLRQGLSRLRLESRYVFFFFLAHSDFFSALSQHALLPVFFPLS